MKPISAKTASRRVASRSAWLAAGLACLAALAWAARGVLALDDAGWSNGFHHPLAGWDHLLTMLAVGVWAAQLRGRAIWQLPLAFVGVMSLGGMAGAAGFALPNVDGVILISCAVFSVFIARNMRFSNRTNTAIVAFFAFFHGFAHGQEISASAGLISYTLGFVLATLLLHGAGILAAKAVLFFAASFLTLFFSQASLANHAKAAGLGKTADGATAVWSGARSGGGILAATLSDHSPPGAMALPRVDGAEACAAAAYYQPATFVDEGGDGPHAARPICFSVSVAAECPPGVALGLSFRHYFPGINFTPGSPLCGNGVGLTSPPVDASFAVPPVIPSVLPLIPVFIVSPVVSGSASAARLLCRVVVYRLFCKLKLPPSAPETNSLNFWLFPASGLRSRFTSPVGLATPPPVCLQAFAFDLKFRLSLK